jgi:hypothetical protein
MGIKYTERYLDAISNLKPVKFTFHPGNGFVSPDPFTPDEIETIKLMLVNYSSDYVSDYGDYGGGPDTSKLEALARKLGVKG